jgi:hypothetical protein
MLHALVSVEDYSLPIMVRHSVEFFIESIGCACITAMTFLLLLIEITR